MAKLWVPTNRSGSGSWLSGQAIADNSRRSPRSTVRSGIESDLDTRYRPRGK